MINRLALLFCLALSGCLGSSTDTVTDGTPGTDAAEKPFTDAYIEFPGPDAKWSGPQGLLIHLSFKNNSNITLEVKGDHDSKNPNRLNKTLNAETAQSELNQLNSLIQIKSAESTEGRDCLYPIRVRLIRSEGNLITKQSCRGEPGWPQFATELAWRWLEPSAPSSSDLPKTAKIQHSEQAESED